MDAPTDVVVAFRMILRSFMNTLSPLVVGEQARVTAARTAGLPKEKRRRTAHVNDRC